jgi:hypothetical protein
MFMCVINRKSVNKLDLTWKQSFLIDQHSSLLLVRKLFVIKIFVAAQTKC